MRRGLDEYQINGIKTTLPFFREVIRDEVFIEGTLDTGFITAFEQRRGEAVIEPDDVKIAFIAAALSAATSQQPQAVATPTADSKWGKAARLAALNNRL
jgi:acetyl/propionyl-CoA carboxylase alpha subunit